MKPVSLFIIRSIVFCLLQVQTGIADEQGLLWQIQGKNTDAYLFGTIHSEDRRVTQLPEPVETSFNRAEILMLEVSLDQLTTATVATRMLQQADGSLSKQMGKSLAEEAAVAMQSRGVPPEVTDLMQPWAVVMTLSAPRQVSGEFLDKQLYNRAIADGKRFQPLEYPDEQLSVFTTLTLDEQKSLLRSVLDEYRTYPRMYERLTEAYLERDLDTLAEISFANPISDDPALQKKFMAGMLTGRNHRMLERMEPLFSQGKVFIAVGALHLVGAEGLISLLRQRGYKLKLLY
ncbi:MAG: TraB/GumN family protein [Candidatus Thiodiazotropha sp. (ex Ctena orbiculata)]|uniref:TraB/GumN family protein n=1 Tax=Candidatus Thiodiazotropha taylori TaxID=2792791 RepID=A0A944M7V0_9GAMM|nr:TraB/GumN family protein [Candidatus Thiodiazotropha taylori]MBT2988859.1 TraB/GumN family protein [Candidatus Thiodiazotropha taylori]MBT2998970.1 TraB/GumN family protein [Candidatus Thiodiazotropha taylori]MBV2109322.1 TraB/GumN family protein [Candidatus Thiodiazotropha taylori]MBV2113325.1 TraB/GumN family protein [Candidatus Thiodiazotropha taylori]